MTGRLTIADIAGEATIDIPTTAKLLGIGRDAGYAAAAAGQIPTLRLSRSLRVPVPALLAMLGVDSSEPTDSEAGVSDPGNRPDIRQHADRQGHDDAPTG
jgi:hypothetical protein